ncbi:ribonuclease P protein component [Myxococcota bacterium]|nr:ribonuclease P protein component [Myxococcota bacterium]
MQTGNEPKNNRLRRAERLLEARDYRRVSRKGLRLTSRGFVMMVSDSREDNLGQRPQRTRLGMSASRRVGNAVVRNRVKRQIREWYRTQKQLIPGGKDYVLIVRRPAAGLSTGEIRQMLSGLIAQLPNHPRVGNSSQK